MLQSVYSVEKQIRYSEKVHRFSQGIFAIQSAYIINMFQTININQGAHRVPVNRRRHKSLSSSRVDSQVVGTRKKQYNVIGEMRKSTHCNLVNSWSTRMRILF